MKDGEPAGELPKGWEQATLGEIANWGSGGTPKSGESSFYDGEIPWAVIGDLSDGEVHSTARCITQVGLEKSSAKIVPAGSLLLAMYGASIGKLGIAGVDMATNQAIAFAPPSSMIDSKYLFYYLLSQRDDLVREGKGAAQKNISQQIIKRWPVPLAPLEEQRRIVAAIEEQLSRLDAAVGTLQSSARRIERCLQAVLHQMTSSHAPVRLRDVLASGLTNGRSVPTRSGGFPVLRLTALSEARVDLTQYKEGDWGRVEAEPFLVQQGDFLIARGNGSVSLVGRGSLVVDAPTPVAYPDTIIRARPDMKKIMPEYLRIVWSSLAVRRQIESRARTTAGIYKVNQGTLGAIEFPLPDMPTQQLLCAQWSNIEQQARHLMRTVAVSQRRSSTLRRSLLAEAFAGRLAPQDPSAEPAGALLARIRAEREAVEVTKSRRRSPRRTPIQRKRTSDAAPAVDAPLPPPADASVLAIATQPTLDLEIPS